MDLATIIGLLLAFGAIFLSVTLEKGALSGFVNAPAFVLVMFGTLGATTICFPLKDLLKLPIVMKQAFFTKQIEPAEMMKNLLEFSRKARREGILALEDEVRKSHIPFLQRGMSLVIDGASPELVREILETELASMQARHRIGIGIFDTLGGFAPTLGILGTVMGLVNMLANLSEPGEMGHAIASAFIATLYGVGSANLIFLPIGNKLKARSHEETHAYELALEGILALQNGDSPRLVASKMQSFLSPQLREHAVQKGREEPSRAREEVREEVHV